MTAAQLAVFAAGMVTAGILLGLLASLLASVSLSESRKRRR